MFNELVDKYYNEIFRYCKYRLNDDEGAKDCTQEVFLTLHKSMKKIKISENIKLWLYRTADLKIKEYWRKNKNNTAVSIEDIDISNIASDEDVHADIETRDIISVLTDDEIKLLKDYYMDRKPEKYLNISSGAVRKRVHKIREKLKLL